MKGSFHKLEGSDVATAEAKRQRRRITVMKLTDAPYTWEKQVRTVHWSLNWSRINRNSFLLTLCELQTTCQHSELTVAPRHPSFIVLSKFNWTSVLIFQLLAVFISEDDCFITFSSCFLSLMIRINHKNIVVDVWSMVGSISSSCHHHQMKLLVPGTAAAECGSCKNQQIY